MLIVKLKLNNNLTSAVTQVNVLEDIASRTGLRISAEKTKFFTNIKNAPTFLVTDIGRTERVQKFKYLREIIQENGLNKSAIEERIHKMVSCLLYTSRCV